MNEAVLSTIESFLPNSTGLGQRGWFHELEEFLDGVRIREISSQPFRFPAYDEAIEQLNAIKPVDRSSFDFEPLDEDRNPALARAAYAYVVLEKIRAAKNGFSEIPIAPDSRLFEVLPGILDAWPVEKEGRILTPDAKVEAFVGRLEEMVDRDSFVRIAGEQISPHFAERAKPCFGTLEDSGGEYCSTLYTDSEDDDLTVDDIKRIIHPLNWDLCCPSFFHKMTQQTPGEFTADGWYRIIESISAEPDEYLLQTALVFSLEERKDKDGNDAGIIINYKLDTNRSGEDFSAGIVEIDNGYLWVTPTHKGPGGTGVRIRTSKEERVNGLSPTATAALGCLLGWSDAGKEMLAGTARKAMNSKLELPVGRALQGWPSSALKLTPVDHDPATVPPDVPATLPINFPDTVDDGRTLARSLVDKVTHNVGDALSRWMDGLVRQDVEDITKEIGSDLRTWSLEVYDTAERNVRPPREDATNG